MRNQYIPEIQGLRTLAAALVAIYHIWFGNVSGGVDIFFVVSAFFIAYTFDKKETINSREIASYYSKTLRRAVPSALLVFSLTCVAIILWVPLVNYKLEIKNSVATFLFIENWYLSFSGKSYLLQNEVKSVFQQFWALSVQVQLYLTIPIFYLLIKKIELKTKNSNLSNLVFTSLFSLSFMYSIFITEFNPQWAYFDTLARGWEFIAGVLLYNNLDRIKMTRKVAYFLHYFALILILTFGLSIAPSFNLPGLGALIPVISAVLIIVTSRHGLRLSILKHKVFTSIGDYSFNFYLWHWPVYILLYNYSTLDIDEDFKGLIVITISFILAYLTTEFIEKPLRRNNKLITSPVKTFKVLFSLFLLSGCLIIYLFTSFKYIEKPSLIALHKFYTTKVLPPLKPNELFPHGSVVKQDIQRSFFNNCEQGMSNNSIVECTYGDKDGEKTIALVGGSHAAQWLAALETYSEKHGFKLHLFIKSGCSFTLSSDELYKPSLNCLEWNQALNKKIENLAPDFLVTTVSRNSQIGEHVPKGYVESWNLTKKNTPKTKLVGIRDNPWFKFDPPLCLELNELDRSSCSISKDTFYNDLTVLPIIRDNLDFVIDLSSEFCANNVCTTVANSGLTKYRDRHHLTKAYTLTLLSKIDKLLDEALK
jgi:peptidoglycan/LPS O-acetylase OafA/YrhL